MRKISSINISLDEDDFKKLISGEVSSLRQRAGQNLFEGYWFR